jgi:hypothetical protein
MDERINQLSEGRILRFDPEISEAYCRSCHHVHRCWLLLPGTLWQCQICEQRTADDAMQIDGVEPDPEQILQY